MIPQCKRPLIADVDNEFVIYWYTVCVRYNMVYSGLYECNEYNAL